MCLIARFFPYSYLGRPLASRPTQAAQKGKIKSWVTTTNSSNNKQMSLLDVWLNYLLPMYLFVQFHEFFVIKNNEWIDFIFLFKQY